MNIILTNLHSFLWTKAHPIHPIRIREHRTESQLLRTLKCSTAGCGKDDITKYI